MKFLENLEIYMNLPLSVQFDYLGVLIIALITYQNIKQPYLKKMITLTALLYIITRMYELTMCMAIIDYVLLGLLGYLLFDILEKKAIIYRGARKISADMINQDFVWIDDLLRAHIFASQHNKIFKVYLFRGIVDALKGEVLSIPVSHKMLHILLNGSSFLILCIDGFGTIRSLFSEFDMGNMGCNDAIVIEYSGFNKMYKIHIEESIVENLSYSQTYNFISAFLKKDLDITETNKVLPYMTN